MFSLHPLSLKNSKAYQKTQTNDPPAWLPGGFTARGIVAIVFSAVSAVLGIAFLVVYGLSDLKFKGDGKLAEARAAGEAESIKMASKDGVKTGVSGVSEGYRDEGEEIK